jgi:CRISPR-associated protein Cas1
MPSTRRSQPRPSAWTASPTPSSPPWDAAPTLGFIHSGHELPFVLDIADLYRTDLGIPLAFDIAAESEEDVGPRTRRALRDRVNEAFLLDRCVRDITGLLITQGVTAGPDPDGDRVVLHTDGDGVVPSALNHSTDDTTTGTVHEEMTW